MSFATAATPNRSTQLVIDPPESVSLRPPWDYKRLAAKMGRYTVPGLGGTTEKMVLVGANAWMLQPHVLENAALIRTEFHDNVIGSDEVEVADIIKVINAWTIPSNLPGVTTAFNIVGSGLPTFIKRVPADGSFNASLTADAAAFPGVPYLSQDIPMSRVLVSYGTYHWNCGWKIVFQAPSGLTGIDNILTFYFGGPTDISDPDNHTGGQYAVIFKGNGVALLWELDKGTWKQRLEFRYAESSQMADTSHTITILPYDRDKIWFHSRNAGGLVGMVGPYNTGYGTFTTTNTPESTLYTHDASSTGFSKNQWMTGVGAIRVDVRDDIRLIWHMSQLAFPSTGALLDAPVPLNYVLPDMTKIRLTVNSWLPPGTAIVPILYDAATQMALSTDSDGNFLSSHGLNQLYAGFTVTSDTLNQYTPVIYDCTLHVDGYLGVRNPNTIQISLNKPITITGPDLTPDQETAHGHLDDALNKAGLLSTRGRIHCQFLVVNEATGGKNTTLFEGELAKAESKTLGKVWPTGSHFPVPGAKSYDMDFVGMWSRLADSTILFPPDIAKDDNAPPNEKGIKPTWKLTDIIKYLLDTCGVPSTAMDIPDNPLRLWANDAVAKSPTDWRLVPGMNCADVLRKLSHDYLGQVLCWDPNAQNGGPGPGMWRLLDNPQPPYTPVFHFFSGSPQQFGFPATIPHFPNAYGPNSYMVQEYKPRFRGPEANYVGVYVCGDQDTSKGTGGTGLIPYEMKNKLSYDFDPSNPTSDPNSPDYLGRFVPLYFVDAGLRGDQAARWVIRRLYQMCCHAQQWVNFHAPLPFITPVDVANNQLDKFQVQPRPLRINDVVTFNTPTSNGPVTLIIRSCNPRYENDGYQMADYEALVVTDIEEYPDIVMGGFGNLKAG